MLAAQTEVSCRQAQRRIGEDVPGPRSGCTEKQSRECRAVKATEVDGGKTFSAYFRNVDEFINRLGLVFCAYSVHWSKVERLLINQQGKVYVAGPNAELAFTELELRELGLEEDMVRAA